MSRDAGRIARDVKSGLLGGLGVSAVYCVWVLGVYALRGSAPFDRNGVTLPGVLVTYLTVGLLAGAVVGVLRPISRRPIGAYVVGFVAAFPIAAGIAVLVEGLPARWDYTMWLALLMTWVVFGAIVGRELRHHSAS